MKTILKISLALLCLASPALGADLDVTDARNNDVDATNMLFRFAEDIGCDVTRRSADIEYFGLTQGGLKIHLGVKASDSNLDRVVAKVTFTGKKEYANSPEIDKLLAKLNRAYNTCSFAIDADGDINFKFALGFDNRLSPKLFRLWCEHISQCVSAIVAKEPELRQRF